MQLHHNGVDRVQVVAVSVVFNIIEIHQLTFCKAHSDKTCCLVATAASSEKRHGDIKLWSFTSTSVRVDGSNTRNSLSHRPGWMMPTLCCISLSDLLYASQRA